MVHASLGAGVTITLNAEVCILGGGPAGAAAAWKLASLGHDVVVVERGARAPPRVGEALSPGIWPVLDLLGLTAQVSGAGFRPTAESVVHWSDDTHVERHPDPPGLMVCRTRFDALLLGHARSAGARVLERMTALRPERTPRSLRPQRAPVRWLVRVRGAGTSGMIGARFLIDARGRGSVFSGCTVRDGAQTVALNGVWRAPVSFGVATRVEAGADAWLWAALRPDGAVSAMAFADTDRYREERANGITREELYRRLLRQSAMLGTMTSGALLHGVAVHDATSVHDSDPVRHNTLKVGEAAFTLDPLSSTGVQRALQSGWQGAIVAHTMLAKPSRAPAAREFYTQAQAAVVAKHRRWAAQMYSESRKATSGHPFWHHRIATLPDATRRTQTAVARAMASDGLLRLSPAVVMSRTPCVVGDLIESRCTLSHPALERPVAYLGGIEISPLLKALPSRLTLSELRERWSRQFTRHDAVAMSDWLLRHEILVP